MEDEDEFVDKVEHVDTLDLYALPQVLGWGRESGEPYRGLSDVREVQVPCGVEEGRHHHQRVRKPLRCF